MGKGKEQEKSPFAIDLTQNERLEAGNAAKRALLERADQVGKATQATLARLTGKKE